MRNLFRILACSLFWLGGMAGIHAQDAPPGKPFDLLQQQVNELRERLDSLSRGVSTPIIWSGGCSAHGVGSSAFIRYCTDSEDFNTALSHLSVARNGDITVLVAGYYRVNFWAISHGCGGYLHAVLKRNGSHFHFGHNRLGEPTQGVWNDNFADVVWPFDAGDVLSVDVFNSGGCSPFAYHAWSPQGAHSRLQVQYLGPN